MNLISLAAPLIRRAAADEDQEQKLFEAFDSETAESTDDSASYASERDDKVLVRLVENPAVREDDLAELTPVEWQWYASWRQALGGRLDPVVLNYLTDSASTRFARYEVRVLVMRDPETNTAASRWVMDSQVTDDDIGLLWLRQQALGARVKKAHDTLLDRRSEAVEALAAARVEQPYEEWNARIDEPPELRPALVEEAAELTQDALQCDTEASRFLLSLLLDGDYADLVSAHIQASDTKRVVSSEITARWYESSSEPLGG